MESGVAAPSLVLASKCDRSAYQAFQILSGELSRGYYGLLITALLCCHSSLATEHGPWGLQREGLNSLQDPP